MPGAAPESRGERPRADRPAVDRPGDDRTGADRRCRLRPAQLRRLAELELRLEAEEPRLAGMLRTGRWRPRRSRSRIVVAALVVAILSALALYAGGPGVAVLAAVTAALVARQWTAEDA